MPLQERYPPLLVSRCWSCVSSRSVVGRAEVPTAKRPTSATHTEATRSAIVSAVLPAARRARYLTNRPTSSRMRSTGHSVVADGRARVTVNAQLAVARTHSGIRPRKAGHITTYTRILLQQPTLGLLTLLFTFYQSLTEYTQNDLSTIWTIYL